MRDREAVAAAEQHPEPEHRGPETDRDPAEERAEHDRDRDLEPRASLVRQHVHHEAARDDGRQEDERHEQEAAPVRGAHPRQRARSWRRGRRRSCRGSGSGRRAPRDRLSTMPGAIGGVAQTMPSFAGRHRAWRRCARCARRGSSVLRVRPRRSRARRGASVDASPPAQVARPGARHGGGQPRLRRARRRAPPGTHARDRARPSSPAQPAAAAQPLRSLVDGRRSCSLRDAGRDHVSLSTVLPWSR